jgi:hypothetical protein
VQGPQDLVVGECRIGNQDETRRRRRAHPNHSMLLLAPAGAPLATSPVVGLDALA